MRIQEVNETDPTPEERELDPSQEADADPDVSSSETQPVTHDESVEAADPPVNEPTVEDAVETDATDVTEQESGASDPTEDEAEPVDGSAEPELLEPEPEVPEEPGSVSEESNAAEPALDAVSVEPEAEPAGGEAEPVQAPATETEIAPAEPESQPPGSVTVSEDPFRGNGDWYVVHTYSGYENKVKANLESRIHTMQMEGKIFGVHIPMEDVMEIKSGKKQVVKKKQFPGYLLVRMIYDNDSWYVVRNTPGVTGFVSAGTGTKPTPLSKHEVEKILAVKKEEVRPQVRLGFEEGDVVRITSGPFADFNGTINEINPDQAKLKVLVNIFDRETPVELSFDQVSKV
jgi:transcription termination/antitermination protein NusG